MVRVQLYLVIIVFISQTFIKSFFMPQNARSFSKFSTALTTAISLSIFVTACTSVSKTAANNQQKNISSVFAGRSIGKPRVVHSEQLSEISNPDIREASGIAESLTQRDILWVINDGGNGPILYAINPQGKTVAHYAVKDEFNRDWEDLTVLNHNGQSFLVIADTGDNTRKHAQYRLIVIPEPKIEQTQQRQILNPLKVINFSYADGARDAESLAYDPITQQLVILTKRDKKPRLYTVPFDIEPGQSHLPYKARLIAELTGLPSPTMVDILSNPIMGQFASQPTAMDITRDGKKMAILTYRHIYLIDRASDGSWSTAFQNEPLKLLTHNLNQAEALSFNYKNNGVFFTSERAPAPLWFAGLPQLK